MATSVRLMTGLRPMRRRDGAEPHRASTPLELFFDLTFVVAISLASADFARQVEAGHGGHGLTAYLMVFFAIWWGWLNFTWFASAYDTDDWLYRLVTLVQMAGALTVAAGVPQAMAHEQFTIVVIGYVIMRLAMVSQWLRAARRDLQGRRTALTYATGITIVQVLWILRLLLPAGLGIASFIVLAVAELAVPVAAEQFGVTPFHRGHVAERYGLFTLIVLGEGVLAAGSSVIAAVDEGEHVAELATLGALGLVIIAAMWWFYFQIDSLEQERSLASTMAWGFGHYLVFAAAGAVSAGLEIQVARIEGHVEASAFASGLTLSVPVGVFLALVWWFIVRPRAHGVALVVPPVAAILAAAAGLLDAPLTVTAATAAIAVVAVVSIAAPSAMAQTRAAGAVARSVPLDDDGRRGYR